MHKPNKHVNLQDIFCTSRKKNMYGGESSGTDPGKGLKIQTSSLNRSPDFSQECHNFTQVRENQPQSDLSANSNFLSLPVIRNYN